MQQAIPQGIDRRADFLLKTIFITTVIAVVGALGITIYPSGILLFCLVLNAIVLLATTAPESVLSGITFRRIVALLTGWVSGILLGFIILGRSEVVPGFSLFFAVLILSVTSGSTVKTQERKWLVLGAFAHVNSGLMILASLGIPIIGIASLFLASIAFLRART